MWEFRVTLTDAFEGFKVKVHLTNAVLKPLLLYKTHFTYMYCSSHIALFWVYNLASPSQEYGRAKATIYKGKQFLFTPFPYKNKGRIIFLLEINNGWTVNFYNTQVSHKKLSVAKSALSSLGSCIWPDLGNVKEFKGTRCLRSDELVYKKWFTFYCAN